MNIQRIFSLLILLISISLVHIYSSGPSHSLFSCPFGICQKNYEIGGFIKEEYKQKMSSLMKEYLENGKDLSFQVSFWRGEDNLVNAYGKSDANEKYDSTYLHQIFSSGKNMEAIVIMMLFDRGLLKYEDKLVKYWPEFGKNGKENITISDVLRHSSGLCIIRYDEKQNETSELFFDEEIFNKNWKVMRERLENAYPQKDCLTPSRGYHGHTRGTILNEIVMRLDPKRRTIGEFVNEEINEKLGVDVHFGTLHQNSFHKIKDVLSAIERGSFKSFFSYFLGTSSKFINKMFLNFMNNTSLIRKSFNIMDSGSFFEPIHTLPKMKKAEIPSVNGISNAQSLAKIGALIANGGSLNGIRLFSESTLKEALSEEIECLDRFVMFNNSFTKGGFASWSKLPPIFGPENYYGWEGFGGSKFYFNTVSKESFAFVPTILLGIDDERGIDLLEVLTVEKTYKEKRKILLSE